MLGFSSWLCGLSIFDRIWRALSLNSLSLLMGERMRLYILQHKDTRIKRSNNVGISFKVKKKFEYPLYNVLCWVLF